jgi:hypothetical protein
MAAFPSGTGRDRSDLKVYVWSMPPRTCAIAGPSVSAVARVDRAPRITSCSYWRNISCGSSESVAASVENVNMQRSPWAITGVVLVRMSETNVSSSTVEVMGNIGISLPVQLACVIPSGDIGMACECCDVVKNNTHINNTSGRV